MEWVIGSFVTVIVIGVVILWVASLIRRLARSRLVIRRYVNPAYQEMKCPSCTLGTQYLHPEKGWGKIPPSLYMIKSGRPWKNAGQANTRRCQDCGGVGYTSGRIREGAIPDFGVREVNW